MKFKKQALFYKQLNVVNLILSLFYTITIKVFLRLENQIGSA